MLSSNFNVVKSVGLAKFSGTIHRLFHNIPFLDFYEKTSGKKFDTNFLPELKKKHTNIENLTSNDIFCTLKILSKFNISAIEAVEHPHIFVMNPITMDNYGEILQECGFIQTVPLHIIRYHTIVRSRTIACLKKEGLIPHTMDLKENLLQKFKNLPSALEIPDYLPETSTNIVKVRMTVLEAYLRWRLQVTSDEFYNYCRNYLPLKHKPMSDIQEMIDIAQKVLQLNDDVIRRNGFLLATDPVNTKLILENVTTLAGLDIKDIIRMEPAVLKNNYRALLCIRSILEEYRIPDEAQRKSLKIFCMKPDTVKERLDELYNLKEFQVLLVHPRVLSMVVHKNKMLKRLNKINETNKKCYSLNNLIASRKVFSEYVNRFGNKACGRDIATLITEMLNVNQYMLFESSSECVRYISNQLKRHNYWLHVTFTMVYDNIILLKKHFDDDVIFSNCHILLYPISDIREYLEEVLLLRDDKMVLQSCRYSEFNHVNYTKLTNSQLLSFILYAIEKKYHFTGDGIWDKDKTEMVQTAKSHSVNNS